MSILVIGLSHHSSPVTTRERFAFPEAQISTTLTQLRASKVVGEGVILSTCNRVEMYVSTDLNEREAFPALVQFLLKNRGCEGTLGDAIYTLGEPRSLEHLFRVASGLDSMVLGETEILGQLKRAYQLALEHGHTGRCLNRAFQKAFNVAKHIRTDTNIQRGSISVSSVAVELAEKIFESLTDRTVLVVGAGDTSEKTARALVSRGVQTILVSNRSYDRAVALAEALGGKALRFEDWARAYGEIDIVISSTAAPHYILDRARLNPLMKLRKNRPLLLIDIAVPRDIEPEVNFLENVYLYNIDDLEAIAADYLKQRRKEIAVCENIIRERARGLLGNGDHFPLGPNSGLAGC